MVIVSMAERRKENRNHRGCQCVLSMGVVLPGVWRGRGQAGEPLGSGCLWSYFCAFRGRIGHAARQTEGEGVTDIQQVVPSARSAGRGFRAYSAKHLDTLVQRAGLPPEERLAVRAVATVLPFRTNSYVVEHLIDWDAAPDDPIYRLVFPQPDMLPEAGRAAARGHDRRRRARGRAARRRARDQDAAQPPSGRPAAAERAQPGRQAAARPAAQVPGNRAVLPPAGPDLPRVLQLLLPLGAVRGRARAEDGHGRRRHAGGLPARASRGDQRPDHRGRSHDHGRGGAAPVHRAAHRPAERPGPHRVDQDRHQVAGLLAAAVRHRPGRRRHPPAVRRGHRLGPESRGDGALLPSARARAAGARRGGAPDQGHRRGDPHPGPADQVDQRRPRRPGGRCGGRRSGWA